MSEEAVWTPTKPRVKQSDLEAIAQRVWSEWANGHNGLGEPVMKALQEVVRLAGGDVDYRE